MAEFQRLGEVERIENASEAATVLIEEGGDIKRISKSKIGGGNSNIVTIFFKNEYYDAALTPGWELPDDSFSNEYECTNMSFTEAKAFVLGGGVLNVMVLTLLDSRTIGQLHASIQYNLDSDSFAIQAYDMGEHTMPLFEWTEQGIVIPK